MSKTRKKFNWQEVELKIIVGVALALLLVWAYAYLPKSGRSKPLPQGPQTAFISSAESGPKMTEATIDPYDPRVGKTQMMSVKAYHTAPIKKILVTMRTDNGLSTPYVLNRVEGTAKNGRWESSWTVRDPHDLIYGAILEAIGEDDSYSKVELTLR